MRKISLFLIGLFISTPAFSAGGGFSLANTDLIVSVAFVIFLAVLAYFGVPKMIAKLLDDRAQSIQDELNQAAQLRDEAQELLASFERKKREVDIQSEAIIERAREEAKAESRLAQEDMKRTIARRIQLAEDQIKSAQEAAMKDVRDKAIKIAVAAAADVIAEHLRSDDADRLIDSAVSNIDSYLN